MTTSPDSQISPQTPKQEGVEVDKSSLDNPKHLRGAIPSVPQALPATPESDHYGDEATESNSAEDADTESETDSEVQMQGQVQPQDQDRVELTISDRSKKPLVQEEDAAESNSAEDAETETETESEVQIQGQVQPHDQDQVVPSKQTISKRSKEPLVREEDKKPSSDPEVVIEQEQEQEISYGPLNANRPSDDDKVEHVKNDSLIPDGQHITQENNRNSDSVVNEEEVSDATLNDPTACRTQPKELIKKDSLASVNAEEEKEEEVEEEVEEEEEEEEEEESIYCGVIGSTTGRPCRYLASECRHHRDSQGRVLDFCEVIGSTTGRPCRNLASECRHHRDSQGRVLNFCEVIGRTTGRPCRNLASECRHHRDSQGRVRVPIYCDVIGRTTGRPCRNLASECPHH
ncbi:hypothetical protein BGZ96_009290 [Linnemannia gamsii]|uniref:Uncharacterized protein n=1 Tax=Linnemannia gamsii TaxID=64522 RepID=A0ABQ7JWQ5_9FUNG|nr:hypothetical protein BGZ96_009290 [Linnemannia gamsii]